MRHLRARCGGELRARGRAGYRITSTFRSRSSPPPRGKEMAAMELAQVIDKNVKYHRAKNQSLREPTRKKSTRPWFPIYNPSF